MLQDEQPGVDVGILAAFDVVHGYPRNADEISQFLLAHPLALAKGPEVLPDLKTHITDFDSVKHNAQYTMQYTSKKA